MAEEIKVVHTGDLHLGMTFKSLGEKSKLHRRDCQDVFSNIVDLTIKEKANALLIAGDLFDEPNPSKSIITFVIEELKRLKEKMSLFLSLLETMIHIKKTAYGLVILFLLML